MVHYPSAYKTRGRYVHAFIVDPPARTGGVVPNIAGDLHKQHLHSVTEEALKRAHMTMKVCIPVTNTRLQQPSGINYKLEIPSPQPGCVSSGSHYWSRSGTMSQSWTGICQRPCCEREVSYHSYNNYICKLSMALCLSLLSLLPHFD